jgi:DNA-binding PadR family transcriptional regulator
MYADNTLTPKEAVRLCALGTLASGPMAYPALADAIRHFVDRVLGPSLEVMGASVELLKYEGLIESTGERLAITGAGREELRQLLTANVRSAATDLNKLVFALKFRFLHLLGEDDRRAQADILVEAAENELARLDDLRQHHAGDEGFLIPWLDHDIQLLESRLSWLKDFRVAL